MLWFALHWVRCHPKCLFLCALAQRNPTAVCVTKMRRARRAASRSVLPWATSLPARPWQSVRPDGSSARGRLSPSSASGPVMCRPNEMRYGSFCLLPRDVSKCVNSWAGHTSNHALSNTSCAVKPTAAYGAVCIGSGRTDRGPSLGRAALSAEPKAVGLGFWLSTGKLCLHFCHN